MFWQGRAVTEFQGAARTWFGTFTMSPEQHALLDHRVRVRLHEAGTRFDHDLSEVDQTAERISEFGLEITKFLKRLRKGDTDHPKPEFRYLLVAEVHDSEQTGVEMRGRPHYHMLLHEVTRGALVKGDPGEALSVGGSGEMERRDVKTAKGWRKYIFATDESWLRRNWTFGFTKFQLAEDANSAAYVCKYLNKAQMARVRASLSYGSEGVYPKRESLTPPEWSPHTASSKVSFDDAVMSVRRSGGTLKPQED